MIASPWHLNPRCSFNRIPYVGGADYSTISSNSQWEVIHNVIDFHLRLQMITSICRLHPLLFFFFLHVLVYCRFSNNEFWFVYSYFLTCRQHSCTDRSGSAKVIYRGSFLSLFALTWTHRMWTDVTWRHICPVNIHLTDMIFSSLVFTDTNQLVNTVPDPLFSLLTFLLSFLHIWIRLKLLSLLPSCKINDGIKKIAYTPAPLPRKQLALPGCSLD